jgi:hypothetical protein
LSAAADSRRGGRELLRVDRDLDDRRAAGGERRPKRVPDLIGMVHVDSLSTGQLAHARTSVLRMAGF